MWHAVQAAYPDADEFVLQLNNAIQTFRNVTFILQSESKHLLDDFDGWYGSWQERMRADVVMRWLHDARTQIVKKGDLATHSTAIVSVRTSWLGSIPLMRFEVPPFVGPEDVAEAFVADFSLPPDLTTEGILEVERCWIEDGLPDLEVLDVLGHCYGFLSEVVADAHGQLGCVMPTVGLGNEGILGVHPAPHLGHRLPCMVLTREARTAFYHLDGGRFLRREELKVEPLTDKEGEEISARYELENFIRDDDESERAAALSFDERFLLSAARYAAVAKRMLLADGEHVTLAMLFSSATGKSSILGLAPADQQEKWLMIQSVADQVRVTGADHLLFITETWSAPEDLLALGQRPVDSPDREEGLLVIALSVAGAEKSMQWFTPFTRDGEGGIVLGETKSGWIMFPQFLVPVMTVWHELWPELFGVEAAPDEPESPVTS